MIITSKNTAAINNFRIQYLQRFIYCILFIVCSNAASAQDFVDNPVIDSLIMHLSVLEDAEEEKADVLLLIAHEYDPINCQRAQEYAKLSLNLSEKLSYQRGELDAGMFLGELILFCDANSSNGISYLSQAMKLALKLDDKKAELAILRDLGFANSLVDETQISINYYNKAIDLATVLGDFDEAVSISGYLGYIYLKIGDTLNCVEKLETVYQLGLENNFEYTNYAEHSMIAEYFNLKGDFESAHYHSVIALDLVLTNQVEFNWISYLYFKRAGIELELGNDNLALDMALKGMEIAEKKMLNKERLDNYDMLAKIYKKKKDYYNATIYLEKKQYLKDSILSIEQVNRQNLYKKEIDYERQQKELEKGKNELIKKDLEAENNQLFIRAITLGLVVTFAFLFLLYRRLRKGNKLNKQLTSQRKQMEKLSIVAANIGQMVMIVGSDDRIEWVNSSFEKKFGYLKFEAIGRTPYELLGGAYTDGTEVERINELIFTDKKAIEAKLTQYSKEGKPFLTRLHISPILNDKKELERYIVISHDITEEQKVAEELKELSLVASNTTNSIIILNNKKQVIWVNDSFQHISGLGADSVLGRTPLDFYNGPLLTEEEQKAYYKKYDEQKPFTIELESTNRITNSNYWISMNVTPVFDDNGKLDKYISVATDITDIKELEAQYGSLVEGSTDMIYEIDISGYFVFVNEVTTKTLGYSKEELREIHFTQLIPEGQRERVQKFYANQISNNEPTSHIEFPTETKHNGIIWVGQRARILYNSADKPTGFSVITRDISEKREAELELKKTYKNTQLLGEIGMQITSTQSVLDVIGQVYENVNKIMDAGVFGIAIPNEQNTKLVFPEVIEKGEHLENFEFDLEDDSRFAVICYKENKEIVIGDAFTETKNYVPGLESVAEPVAGEAAYSVIYLPLHLRGKTIGVITVQSFAKNAFDEHQVDLVRSLASFVAIAMENATLYETMEDNIAKRTREVQRQKEKLEINYLNTRLLSDIGQLVSSTLDLNEIFEELAAGVGQLMDAEMFGIFTTEDDDKVINYKYIIEKGKRYESFTTDVGDVNSYTSWCVLNRKELLITDNETEYHKYIDKILIPHGDAAQSLIFYPMMLENRLIGVITVQSSRKNAYKDYHFDILKTLASSIVTVIDNAELYNTLEMKVRQRTLELEQKNNDITASINYAKRLQKGILPAKSFMKRLFPESFVYFRPKDIVSGDFYWVDRTRSKILFAVVDCTGHGVPGAMMSIIGRNLLDQAVNEKGITMPAQILNFLQVGLSLAFGQTGERKADLFDGMDLALCSIDLQSNLLEFAGANSSLYLIQDEELIVLKGDKVGISAEYEVSNSYTNLEIEIQKGDVVYLTSDGLPDQFGGPNYKKYTYKRMNDLFARIHKLDMLAQHESIKEEIEGWQGVKSQTDDICVMGIRID